ncbi:hypothetical protein J5N97_028092 [Dioscorea zingiberensis]|uniref:DUF7722 domain-containing protein n=1 Tax=Dioscorea zingiberensis TaxID=325984 RepID=A0A9D5H4D4_9LILI|nr:hypothetical protein J5N97_028092 [Dioscorea zingiberensis]
MAKSTTRQQGRMKQSNSFGAYGKDKKSSNFQMPLHYPRYTKADYEIMPEWTLDCLLAQYGLPVSGGIAEKRSFAMGTFLWTLH